jgi:hypothetical protein
MWRPDIRWLSESGQHHFERPHAPIVKADILGGENASRPDLY